MNNSKILALIKDLNKIKTDEDTDCKQVASQLAMVVAIKKIMEDKERILKKHLMDNKFDGYEYITEVALKVYKAERKTTEYDTIEIGKAFQKAKKLQDFFKIVNIVQRKLSDIELTEVLKRAIEKHKSYTTSESIMVTKMNRDEIADMA